jgi:uncharacterized protein (TIGR03067 family)
MGLWHCLKNFWRWLRHGAGMGVEELARRLAFNAADLEAIEPGYREFTVPKRSGGKRRLCAPHDHLKALQRFILRRLLRRLKCHPAATGFQPGQSIVTHARRHVGQAVVVRLDLKDFFPATAAWRVRRYFRRIGWNRPAARLLTRLCTHRGGLPQGAPTSPRLSNLVNYRLDCRLAGMARKLGAGYSRYADDITLSFPLDDRRQIRYLIRFVRNVVHAEGYRLHGGRKMLIRRQHQQQRVTGLVVNTGAHLPRALRRRLRAVSHHLRTGRPATLTSEQFAGWEAFQHMIAVQGADAGVRKEMLEDQHRLQGAWVLIGHEKSAESALEGIPEAEDGTQWIFRGTRVVFRQGDGRVEARVRLAPLAMPKAIDLIPTNGPRKGRRIRGIYDWQSEQLRLCLNGTSRKRPTKFKDSARTGWSLLILSRVQDSQNTS